MAKIKVIYIVLLCIAVFSLAGCMEDESFTQTPADTLGFSADTIRFNTVYSGIGSRTEELTVYNPNDKGLKLASIRLASGGSLENFYLRIGKKAIENYMI